MRFEDKPWLKYYDPWVLPELEVPPTTYMDLFEKTFKEFPDKPSLHFLGTALTFAQLDDCSARFASYLKEIGCGSKDVIGICLPNFPQWLIAYLGALRAGCVTTGVSPLLRPKEMQFQLSDSGAKAIVIMDVFYENTFLKIADDLRGVEHVIVTAATDYFPEAIKPATPYAAPAPRKQALATFMNVMEQSLPVKGYARLKPDDPCVIQYTGGTTGTPKGAIVSHQALIDNTRRFENWLGEVRGRSVSISAFPLFHMAGLWSISHYLQMGFTQVLIPNPRDTKYICQAFETYRPNEFGFVPSLYQMLLDTPEFRKLDFSNVDHCISGAAPMPLETLQALENLIGKGKVVEIYGLTESAPLITMNPKNRPKPGSVGVPIQNVMVKLVDLETETTEVPIGEPGHLIYRAPNMITGYHERPEDTEATFRLFQGERWLFTGDVARMDEEGYLYIVDRTKDMIIVSGYKVFSKEVEETLYQHPSVQYCAVVGVPNPERPGSDQVKALIQLTDAYKNRDPQKLVEEIIKFCRENMSPYKVPKIIEFTEAIPLTPIGKVDKKVLR
ncbi:MAG: AMP-binding protein [Deltaproteobacteria bacterium]|nr:AMP-binding protein [Deltaproteobacteria bacterium]